MSAINPASFASQPLGLQAPSGIGPGAVGVGRGASNPERRPNNSQPAQEQPPSALPSPGPAAPRLPAGTGQPAAALRARPERAAATQPISTELLVRRPVRRLWQRSPRACRSIRRRRDADGRSILARLRTGSRLPGRARALPGSSGRGPGPARAGHLAADGAGVGSLLPGTVAEQPLGRGPAEKKKKHVACLRPRRPFAFDATIKEKRIYCNDSTPRWEYYATKA